MTGWQPLLLQLGLAALFATTSTQRALAGEWTFHGPSYHSNGATNNRTWGLGHTTDSGLGVGMYRNSEGRLSAYAHYRVSVLEPLSLQLVLATGYARSPVVPGVLADLAFPLGGSWALHFMGSPTYDSGRLGLMLHLALSLRL